MENIETKTQKCLDCGTDGIKNMGSHKRFCKARKDISPQKTDTIPTPAEPEQTQREPVIIKDIHEFRCMEVAWFEDKTYKEITHIGTLHNGIDEIPCILAISQMGTILPVFMINGFIGMHPVDQEWEDIEQHEQPIQEDEPFPPFKVEEEEQPIEPPIKQAPSNTITKPEKKPGLLSRLLSPKKQATIDPETHALLQGIVNAKI